ncbi:DUF3990 domain-containing protein [Blautia wexlerae]|nr:DUF3990 domain-containing protein [Blautia wexlerae]NSF78499.1 DUF3990 domain-containing protein [Blautia wexlerae]
MIVYHGSTEIINKPDVIHSKKYLDFGRGLWDKEKVLRELRYYKLNNQICIVNQETLNQLIIFKSAYEVENNGR